MSAHATNGRPWAKLSELKAGDTVETDEGFTCMGSGKFTVRADHTGQLYIDCDEGGHYLQGQADDGNHLVGIYRV